MPAPRSPRLTAGAALLGAALAVSLLATCSRSERTALDARVPPDRIESRAPSAPPGTLPGEAATAKRILFGDLHVHTTLSSDAFFWSLPLMGGTGAHPPDEACDYARFCSGLDFFSFNDHALSMRTEDWETLKQATRTCNALAGPPEAPDVVVFPGWEWTQMGSEPGNHYGHKNVIFRETDEERLPVRPISAARQTMVTTAESAVGNLVPLSIVAPHNAGIYLEYRDHLLGLLEGEVCPEGVDTRELPRECFEEALEPAVLFEKLDQWGFESMVIPHGNAWGLHVPSTSSWDNQLDGRNHDPERQRLIEVYSGHGSSEEHRPWRAFTVDPDGARTCPAPTEGYLPCCWRAGELARERCDEPGSATCDAEVAAAMDAYMVADLEGWRTIPDADPEEWLDCGQCRDCFQPAFNYRPGASTQYALARTGFEEGAADGDRVNYRFGFIGSSDNHKAQPGTGYREKRKAYTDSAGETNAVLRWIFSYARREGKVKGAGAWELERQGSFWYTGGLVAVHSGGRDRDAIWDSLVRREVYGTSGERILLWFDLLGGAGGIGGPDRPMGAAVTTDEVPRFRVRAAGAFKQKPGCPEDVRTLVGDDLLEDVCLGECYNPTDERHLIDRIEVVRILPQAHPDDPVDGLIEDPWMVLPCAPDPAGCTAEFSDPSYPDLGRTAIYYVRVIQEDGLAVNAGNLRCTWDEQGNCVSIEPCYASSLTDPEDDCLAPSAARAWSSPIFLDPLPAPVPAPATIDLAAEG